MKTESKTKALHKLEDTIDTVFPTALWEALEKLTDGQILLLNAMIESHIRAIEREKEKQCTEDC